MRCAALPRNDARSAIGRTGPPTVVARFQLEDAIANLERRRKGLTRFHKSRVCEEPCYWDKDSYRNSTAVEHKRD